MNRIAVIGCGYWGKNLVRNFYELGRLAAIYDANTIQAEKISHLYQVPVLSFEEILSNKDIQGIVIATPAIFHAQLAERGLNAGKHVFVEKPLALHSEEASKLCHLAYQQDRVLMVGHLLQYHPAFLELNRLVRDGEIGKVLYIYSNRLNLGKIRNEENILWSFAPHDISMILTLARELPETVYCSGTYHLNPKIADITNTHLTFNNGINAHIFVSWLHPYKEQKLIVIGDKGMAVFDDGHPWESKLQLYSHKIQWINGLPCPDKANANKIVLDEFEPLRLECQHFLDCIETRQSPRTNGEEGLKVLRVLEAAERSLKTNLPVTIQDSPSHYFKHTSACIDNDCEIGSGTKIWHFSHILSGSKIGKNVIISQNVMIGPEVNIGNNCKIQNNVSIYKGVTLENGVFCGPSCVFTNVNTPRAEIERKNEFKNTYVEQGVTIGANATIVCGNRLGAYCFIGAGAVVTKDVLPHALMVGNPARQIGWVSHAGERLGKDLTCPREKKRYRITLNNRLEEITDKKSTPPLQTALHKETVEA